MQIPRNSPTQSANYAKFAHFVNLFYIMFQAPAPAENPAKFQRITQIPRNSPTQSANDTKFAPFIHIIHYVSDAWPVAGNAVKFQRIKWNSPDSPPYTANYANPAHFAPKLTYVIDFQISDHRQRTQENWSESTRFRSIRPPITRITRIPRISQ